MRGSARSRRRARSGRATAAAAPPRDRRAARSSSAQRSEQRAASRGRSGDAACRSSHRRRDRARAHAPDDRVAVRARGSGGSRCGESTIAPVEVAPRRGRRGRRAAARRGASGSCARRTARPRRRARCAAAAARTRGRRAHDAAAAADPDPLRAISCQPSRPRNECAERVARERQHAAATPVSADASSFAASSPEKMPSPRYVLGRSRRAPAWRRPRSSRRSPCASECDATRRPRPSTSASSIDAGRTGLPRRTTRARSPASPVAPDASP